MDTRASSILASGQITLVNLDDTFTVSLTNEAQVIPTTTNRLPLATKTYNTVITVYQGTTPYTDFTIGTVNSANGITVTKTQNTVKFTVNTNTALSVDDGEFIIPIIIDEDITINKTFSWTCSKQGDSVDAKYVIVNGEQIFMYTDNFAGTPTPNSITLTAQAFGISSPKYTWGYRTTGSSTVTTISGQTTNTLSVAYNASMWGSNKQLTFRCTVDGVYYDEITIAKISSGTNGTNGKDGTNGVSITSVDTEYYLSTSSTSVTGGSWSTTAPTWTSGKYMWSRMKTTYSTGSTTYSNPVCITGQQGQTGSTGTGISSITEEYYLSTSKTTQAGGSWGTTPPTWQTGTYLWTRNKIVYTNPSSTVYTTPVCDSSWEAVNEIEVSGRNLLKIKNLVNRSSQNFSKTGYEVSLTHASEFEGVQFYNMADFLEVGETYILQYKIKKTAGSLIGVAQHTDGQFGYLRYTVDGITRDPIATVTDMGIDDENWHQCVLMFRYVSEALGDGTGSTNRIIPQPNRGLPTSVSVVMKDFKIEKGNIKTGWMPAPEDVQEEINNAVASVDVMYYLSTSATSLAGGSWSTTAPAWVNGKYMWQKTVTTLKGGSVIESDPTCIAGASGSDGKGIKSIVEQYYHSTSMTALAGGSWSTTVPTPTTGKYIWTRSIITYTDNSTTTTGGVCSTGPKGDKGDTGASGKGVSSITEYYLATSASSGVTTSTSGWTTGIQSMTSTNRYLWNYEVIKYTDNSTTTTTPVVIGVYGNTGSTGATGNGISSITNYYLATTAGSGVTTSTSGWTTTVQTMTTTNKYLWNYEVIKYTNSTSYTGTPRIIGVYGATGATGASGADAYTVILSNENHTFPAEYTGSIGTAISTTSSVIAYKGATKVATTVGTITNPSGMTITINSNGTTSTSLTITANSGTSLAETGSVNIPITVDGKSFTRTFSWTKAKKGGTGANAKSVDIIPSTQYFKSTDGGITFSPDTITLTPLLQELTFSKWQYSVNGGSTYTDVRSGSNGLTVSNGVLTIAKSSALYTTAVTSIVFKLITNNSTYYDTITIARLYDVADLEIGGQNLLSKTDISKYGVGKWVTNGGTISVDSSRLYVDKKTIKVVGNGGIYYNDFLKLARDTTYTYSMMVYSSTALTVGSTNPLHMWVNTTVSSGHLEIIKSYSGSVPANTWTKIWIVFSTPNAADVYYMRPFLYGIGEATVNMCQPMLEKGNRASDWCESLEDLRDYAEEQVNNQTQSFIFNKLTNNGALQGLYMQNSKLYVNASYVKSGTFEGVDFIAGGTGTDGSVIVKDSSNNVTFLGDKNGVKAKEITFFEHPTASYSNISTTLKSDGVNISYFDDDTELGSTFSNETSYNFYGLEMSRVTNNINYRHEVYSKIDVFGALFSRTGMYRDEGYTGHVMFGLASGTDKEDYFSQPAIVYNDKHNVTGEGFFIAKNTTNSSLKYFDKTLWSGSNGVMLHIDNTGTTNVRSLVSKGGVSATTFAQSNYALPAELGRYIDLHNAGSTNDVDVRLETGGTRERLRVAMGSDLSQYTEIGRTTSKNASFIKNGVGGQFLAMEDGGRLTYDGATVPHNWRQSFTPFIFSDNATWATSSATGQAVYLGDLIFVQGRVIADKGGASGKIYIGGLPQAAIYNYPPVTIGFFGGASSAMNSLTYGINGYIQAGTSNIYLNFTLRDANWQQLGTVHVGTRVDVCFSAVYRWR